MCENDTFNSKFEPGEMIFDCFGFSFLISASTFFNVKKKNQLEDSEVTSDCVSHDATASGDQVGFNGQLFGKSVWCGGVAGAGGAAMFNWAIITERKKL